MLSETISVSEDKIKFFEISFMYIFGKELNPEKVPILKRIERWVALSETNILVKEQEESEEKEIAIEKQTLRTEDKNKKTIEEKEYTAEWKIRAAEEWEKT